MRFPLFDRIELTDSIDASDYNGFCKLYENGVHNGNISYFRTNPVINWCNMVVANEFDDIVGTVKINTALSCHIDRTQSVTMQDTTGNHDTYTATKY